MLYLYRFFMQITSRLFHSNVNAKVNVIQLDVDIIMKKVVLSDIMHMKRKWASILMWSSKNFFNGHFHPS